MIILVHQNDTQLGGTPMDPYDGYTTAELNPELLDKVQQLEKEIRSTTNGNIVLIAYEDQGNQSRGESPTSEEDVEIYRNNFCE
jgi:hypothetical protein